ncbi:MAG: hypothetical protein ACI4GC_07040 [Acutalibacteraceae bacterium]
MKCVYDTTKLPYGKWIDFSNVCYKMVLGDSMKEDKLGELSMVQSKIV